MEAMNIKFVGEVEKYPELYDFTRGDYQRNDASAKAWNKIAKEVNMSAKECKEKWRNLRTAFVRNLRPCPNGPQKSKKPYYLHRAMQFTLPFVKSGVPSSGNLLPKTKVEDMSNDDSSDSIDEPEIELGTNQAPDSSPLQPPATSCRHTSFSSASLATSPVTMEHETPHSESEPNTESRKRRLSTSNDDSACFTIKKCKMYDSLLEDRKTAVQQFLNSLMPDLLSMTDVQLRSYKRSCLLLIDQVLGTADLETCTRPHSHLTS